MQLLLHGSVSRALRSARGLPELVVLVDLSTCTTQSPQKQGPRVPWPCSHVTIHQSMLKASASYHAVGGKTHATLPVAFMWLLPLIALGRVHAADWLRTRTVHMLALPQDYMLVGVVFRARVYCSSALPA